MEFWESIPEKEELILSLPTWRVRTLKWTFVKLIFQLAKHIGVQLWGRDSYYSCTQITHHNAHLEAAELVAQPPVHVGCRL